VSSATPPPVSLLTHKTSCTSGTSSTHTAREGDERRSGTIIPKGVGRNWSAQQDKLHQGCHPEVCRWRGTTKGLCLPSMLVPVFAGKLFGVASDVAIADVIAWARSDAPPPGTVAAGDDFRHWRDRWNATRATPAPRPLADAGGSASVPGVAATDALLDELTGGFGG
jgi:hypothetical protein